METRQYEKLMLKTWAMTDDAKSTYWHHTFNVRSIGFDCSEEDADHRLEAEIIVRGEVRDCIFGCHFAVVGKKISVTHVSVAMDKGGRLVDVAYGNVVMPNKLHRVLTHEDMLYRVTLHFLNVLDVTEGVLQRGESF